MSAKAVQHVEQCLERQALYSHLNAFISRPPAAQLRDAGRFADAQSSFVPLHGRVIAIKDNITTTSLPTTAASELLENYTSPLDATLVSRLHENGAIIAGKTNLDEFGMGSHSRSPFSGPVLNHLTRSGQLLSAGGSSGGSAVAVATGQCWAAIGTDTGGSVRLPSSYTGTVGFKPSYGLISRWGVIAYANSLDTVGTLTSNVADARTLFDVLQSYDARDPTSLPESVRQRIRDQAEQRTRSINGKRRLNIGVPLSYNTSSLSATVKNTWIRTLQKLQDQGHILHTVPLSSTPLALSAYYILAPAEASSNLAKYDGVRYGHRTSGPDASPSISSPLFAATRSAFGDEVKRRVLLGAYTLSSEAMDNYFVQAQRVRRLVQRDFDAVFETKNPLLIDEGADADRVSRRNTGGSQDRDSAKVDVLIAPTAPTLPPTVDEVEAQTSVQGYMNDVFTVPASLAGLPAVSVPVRLAEGYVGEGENEVSTAGMQVIGQYGDDGLVLDVAEMVEGL